MVASDNPLSMNFFSYQTFLIIGLWWQRLLSAAVRTAAFHKRMRETLHRVLIIDRQSPGRERASHTLEAPVNVFNTSRDGDARDACMACTTSTTCRLSGQGWLPAMSMRCWL